MDKTAPIVSTETGDPSPAFEIVSLAAFGISCLVIAYRILARILAKRKRYVKDGVGTDDYFAISALILAGGVTAQIVVAVRYGIDEDRDEQDANELRHQLQVKETYKYSNLKGEAADSQR
ncbi:hypothetical protein MMC31_007857, partial [Peltigera leucophlebia]|nr:hypothetical protein [Peltigera leucophlebia]